MFDSINPMCNKTEGNRARRKKKEIYDIRHSSLRAIQTDREQDRVKERGGVRGRD